MLDLLASTRPTSKSDRLSWRVKSQLWLAVGRTLVTASIDIFTDCKIANRIAGRDRVGRPPPIVNSTNSNASCDARLHRKGGCPVHQLARSWLQYRLKERAYSGRQKRTAGVKIQTASESKFLLLAAQSVRPLTPNCNYSHSSLAKTIKTIKTIN